LIFIVNLIQKKPNKEAWLEALLEIYETFYLSKRFYFHYNSVYWYLRLKQTPLQISFSEVPINPAFLKSIDILNKRK